MVGTLCLHWYCINYHLLEVVIDSQITECYQVPWPSCYNESAYE